MEYNPFFDICDLKGDKLLGSLFGTAYKGSSMPKQPRANDVFIQVPCTLFEFYNGCVKTIKY